MKQDPYLLRDQVAGPTLKRIGDDRKRVCDELKPALGVIERRLFDPGLDVNAVWRESGLNKRSSPLFKDQLGKTPLKYIGTCRVEVAVKLVAGTELKLPAIAEALGYPTTTDTFARTFQERFGLRPFEYRRAVKEGRDGAPSLEDLPILTEKIGLASAAGDFDGANQALCRVSAAVREKEIRELSAKLALACHERGAQRTREGDVDQAYEDLALARNCYVQAGDLEPALLRHRRHIAVSHATDQALTSELCPDCRTKLAGDQGRTVRQALRQALRLIPRDLEWFDVCCDDCYRVAWKAVSRARAGLMDDAWKAWWISSNADLADRETPPSRGRIIAAITEVERLVTGDQLERKVFCDFALDDALAVGDPLLETQARIWRASILRATGDFAESRAELRLTAQASRASPWLAALQDRMIGILERETNHWKEGVAFLASAISSYGALDTHIGGLVLMAKAIAHFFLEEYVESVACNEKALSLLDSRRDPLPSNGIVPVNLAGYYAVLGDWDSAESALSRCRFEREAHPSLSAMEIFIRACLELLHRRERHSVRLFSEARECFERIHRPLDAALAAAYSVEAHARLGDRARAIDSSMAAFSFFRAAGCTQATLESANKLRALLDVEIIDVMAVTAGARRLARQHGGWLPE